MATWECPGTVCLQHDCHILSSDSPPRPQVFSSRPHHLQTLKLETLPLPCHCAPNLSCPPAFCHHAHHLTHPSPLGPPHCLFPYSLPAICLLSLLLGDLVTWPGQGHWSADTSQPLPAQFSPRCSRTGDVTPLGPVASLPWFHVSSGRHGDVREVAVVPAFQHSFPPLGTGPDIVHPPVCLLGEVWDGTQARRGHTRETIQPRCKSSFSPPQCDIGLFPLHGHWPAILLGSWTVAGCEAITCLCSVPEKQDEGLSARARVRRCRLGGFSPASSGVSGDKQAGTPARFTHPSSTDAVHAGAVDTQANKNIKPAGPSATPDPSGCGCARFARQWGILLWKQMSHFSL